MAASADHDSAPASLWTAFAAGALATTPTLMMIAPFGALCGAIFSETGLTVFEAFGFSALIYAGAAQLATLELLRDHASILVILATGAAINLRFAMYAAVATPWWRGSSVGARSLSAYFMADNILPIALVRYHRRPNETVAERIAFFTGCGALSWSSWQGATVFGFYLGAAAPDWLGLDFAAPIAFLGIAMPLLADRPSWAAAVAAAVSSILLRNLPLNLGVILAGCIGVAAGLIVETRLARGSETAS